MGEYHQFRDGNIAVRHDDESFYLDTADNFVADGGPPPEPLEFDGDERIYTQGKRHAIQKDGNVVGGGPMPWPEGDEIIANLAAYQSAQQARKDAPDPMNPTLDMGGTMYSTINKLNPPKS
jgi:hypothetical protein